MVGRQCLIKEFLPVGEREKVPGLGSKRTYNQSGLEKSKELTIKPNLKVQSNLDFKNMLGL